MVLLLCYTCRSQVGYQLHVSGTEIATDVLFVSKSSLKPEKYLSVMCNSNTYVVQKKRGSNYDRIDS